MIHGAVQMPTVTLKTMFLILNIDSPSVARGLRYFSTQES
jgi:hypothetical protein